MKSLQGMNTLFKAILKFCTANRFLNFKLVNIFTSYMKNFEIKDWSPWGKGAKSFRKGFKLVENFKIC